MRTEGDWRSRMVIEEGSIPGALGRPMVPAMAGFAEMIGKATDDSFSGKQATRSARPKAFCAARITARCTTCRPT
jgi:cholesterol oxidase